METEELKMEIIPNTFPSAKIQRVIALGKEIKKNTYKLDNELVSYTNNYDNITLEYINNNELYVYYRVKNKEAEDFKSYIKNIDDDIFIDTCENFDTRPLNKELLNPTDKLGEEIKLFKEAVKIAVIKKVEALITKYSCLK